MRDQGQVIKRLECQECGHVGPAILVSNKPKPWAVYGFWIGVAAAVFGLFWKLFAPSAVILIYAARLLRHNRDYVFHCQNCQRDFVPKPISGHGAFTRLQFWLMIVIIMGGLYLYGIAIDTVNRTLGAYQLSYMGWALGLCIAIAIDWILFRGVYQYMMQGMKKSHPVLRGWLHVMCLLLMLAIYGGTIAATRATLFLTNERYAQPAQPQALKLLRMNTQEYQRRHTVEYYLYLEVDGAPQRVTVCQAAWQYASTATRPLTLPVSAGYWGYPVLAKPSQCEWQVSIPVRR